MTAGRKSEPFPSDDELVARLRSTFREEADAVVPFGDRPRAIASLEARRARMAARRQRVLGAAAAVALVAAGVGIATAVRRPASTPVGVVSGGTSSAGPTVPIRSVSGPESTPAPRITGPGTAQSGVGTEPGRGSVPSSFVPISVTFVPSPDGWVLGTVRCANGRCLDLARTTDAGSTWTNLGQPRAAGTTAPVLPSAGGAAAQLDLGVRFANGADGWIYGTTGDDESLLWSTEDGGLSWSVDPLPPSVGAGWVARDLETTDGRVQVVLLTADPSRVQILTAPDGTNDWAVSATTLATGTGSDPAPDLVLQQAAGWLVEDNGRVLSGARLGADGTWQSWDAPCEGTGTTALLAAPVPSSVIAVCPDPAVPGTPAGVESSVDGGLRFDTSGQLPAAVTPSTVTAATPDVVVVGGTDGTDGVIWTSLDAGRHWLAAYASPTDTDLRQIGFETTTQGVAVAASTTGAELLMTFDGGRSWKPVDFQG